MSKAQVSPTAPAQPANSYHHGDLRRALIDTALAMVTEEGPGTSRSGRWHAGRG